MPSEPDRDGEPAESDPLLTEQGGQNISNDSEPHHQLPKASDGTAPWSEDAIRTLSAITAFLVLFTFADLLKYVSTVRLLELGVCREHHLRNHHEELVDGDGYVPEALCKSSAIQADLAHLRGYYSALDSVVGLVLTIPYGLLVGRLGERLLVAANIIGYLLACAWFLVVAYAWTVLPIRAAVLAPLFRVVGGGSPFLYSMVYSIAAKHIPSAKRSSAFFIFLAAQTITSTLATLVAASLLDNKMLLLPLVLNFPIGFVCLISLAVVRGDGAAEPLPASSSSAPAQGDGKHASSKSIRGSLRMLVQVLRDPIVVGLLATVPVAKAVNPIGELTWQYIPKKFDVSFATTSRVLSIPSLECVVLLLWVLPGIKSLAQSSYHVASMAIDLYFVQFGFLIQGVGCFIMASAPALSIFVLGILIFALGCSTRPALQSVLADLASPDSVPVLFTIIAVADLIGSAAGTLLLNWIFSIVLDWEDDLLLGSPFAIVGACFLIATVVSAVVGPYALRSSRAQTVA